MKAEKPGQDKRPQLLFIEPFSGISGDMLLGALLNLGMALPRLEDMLRRLPLSGYRLSLTGCSRAGIRADKFDVACDAPEGHHHHHRSFRDIRSMIESADLSPWVREKSIEAFRRLAEAEGKIHNLPPDQVHFHEVGAVDSIVDMVGTMVAIEELMPIRVISAEVNVGQGALDCRHGRYPAPGPATVELLKGVPVYASGNDGELTTPTGAALLTTLAEGFGPRPLMTVDRIGYGAGSRDIPGAANVLRITLGEEWVRPDHGEPSGKVVVIEATVDDMNPQVYGYLQEKILAAGALDVFAIPAQMKKNRPGLLLSVVCDPGQVDAMAEVIFSESTTIGFRYMLADRKTLDREFFEVVTEYGKVTVKASSCSGRYKNIAPEYECCRRLALERNVPLKEIMAAASRAFEHSPPDPSLPPLKR
jgi:pyridinium-3,5-bisthiocarboxylic acid mononucleotide nickel chelatase